KNLRRITRKIIHIIKKYG
nr:Chain A, T7 NOVISPIRIN [unidentified]